MKAAQLHKIGGPEFLEIHNIKEPKPSAHEVRVKLYATGLNPSENYLISGKYGYTAPELPIIPGSDGAGIIDELGEGVEQFNVGDRVFISAFAASRNTGTYAEKVVVDADAVFHLPDSLSFKEGAALGIPVFTAYQVLTGKAKITADETVLIHGASGAVGSLAIQIAKAAGAIVIGTSGTKEGRELILSLGADFALNHITSENKDELLRITNQKGPNVIIEMLANVNLEIDTKVIARNGRVVIVGSRGSIEVTPRNLMRNEAIVTGFTLRNLTKENVQSISREIVDLLKKDAIKPVVGNTFSLEEASKAQEWMMNSSGNGRTILAIEE